MDSEKAAEQAFGFFRSTFERTFNAMLMLQEQSRNLYCIYLDQRKIHRLRRYHMVQRKEKLKQMIEINKITCEIAFMHLTIFQEQMEALVSLAIDQTWGMSEEGKKAAKERNAMYRKGLDDFKNLVENNFKKMESCL